MPKDIIFGRLIGPPRFTLWNCKSINLLLLDWLTITYIIVIYCCSLAEQLESIKESFDQTSLSTLSLFFECKKVDFSLSFIICFICRYGLAWQKFKKSQKCTFNYGIRVTFFSLLSILIVILPFRIVTEAVFFGEGAILNYSHKKKKRKEKEKVNARVSNVSQVHISPLYQYVLTVKDSQ